jgi:hypothetical protein
LWDSNFYAQNNFLSPGNYTYYQSVDSDNPFKNLSLLASSYDGSGALNGFVDYFSYVAPVVSTKVMPLIAWVNESPETRSLGIKIAGHSLGGAAAEYMGLYLHLHKLRELPQSGQTLNRQLANQYDVEVFAFSPPKSGDKSLARFIASQASRQGFDLHVFANSDDLVYNGDPGFMTGGLLNSIYHPYSNQIEVFKPYSRAGGYHGKFKKSFTAAPSLSNLLARHMHWQFMAPQSAQGELLADGTTIGGVSGVENILDLATASEAIKWFPLYPLGTNMLDFRSDLVGAVYSNTTNLKRYNNIKFAGPSNKTSVFEINGPSHIRDLSIMDAFEADQFSTLEDIYDTLVPDRHDNDISSSHSWIIDRLSELQPGLQLLFDPAYSALASDDKRLLVEDILVYSDAPDWAALLGEWTLNMAWYYNETTDIAELSNAIVNASHAVQSDQAETASVNIGKTLDMLFSQDNYDNFVEMADERNAILSNISDGSLASILESAMDRDEAGMMLYRMVKYQSLSFARWVDIMNLFLDQESAAYLLEYADAGFFGYVNSSIKVELDNNWLQLKEVEVKMGGQWYYLNDNSFQATFSAKDNWQNNMVHTAEKAGDGLPSGSMYHSGTSTNPWWEASLQGLPLPITDVRILTREDGYGYRINTARIILNDITIGTWNWDGQFQKTFSR